jgi:HEPN domain-containing protein
MPKPINANDLKRLAKARLDDAITLYKQERYEGAIYLCGYAVELALKYKICQKLSWNKYLPARFDNERTFYTHKLEELKFLSGMQNIFDDQNTQLWSYWTTITSWNEQLRYNIATQSKSDARASLRAAIRLYKELTK